ncbi:MAG: NADP-dependent isocitrate dehydrogenase [Anaerolineales bacterium]
MKSAFFNFPSEGKPITSVDGKWVVPNSPIIPFIEGDGIGPDIWQATRPVLDEAVRLAYSGSRKLGWIELLAGEKAIAQIGNPLPDETLRMIAKHRVAIKGPLTTPIRSGFRSLNVAIRRELDLYACVRPVRWLVGVPSPVCHPERVNMVIFRENTEDLYAGIEFEEGDQSNWAFQTWLAANQPDEFAKIRFPQSVAFSLKPISRQGSERLIRAALNYALENNHKQVTLVHKGNIMKFTEGAFAAWGYDLAEREFSKQVYTQRQYQQTLIAKGQVAADEEQQCATERGDLMVNDVIADAAFEQALTRPASFDVIATTNLNGDYLSDALSAQVGGLGMAPGANINFETQVALFEATHGTAPSLAGTGQANPCSLILSGQLMLRYLGWDEAADLVEKGIQATILSGLVTADLQRLKPGTRALSTIEFGQAVIHQMQSMH